MFFVQWVTVVFLRHTFDLFLHSTKQQSGALAVHRHVRFKISRNTCRLYIQHVSLSHYYLCSTGSMRQDEQTGNKQPRAPGTTFWSTKVRYSFACLFFFLHFATLQQLSVCTALVRSPLISPHLSAITTGIRGAIKGPASRRGTTPGGSLHVACLR